MITLSLVFMTIMFIISIYFSFRNKQKKFIPYFLIVIAVFIVSYPILFPGYIIAIDSPNYMTVFQGLHFNIIKTKQFPYRINYLARYGVQIPIFYHFSVFYLFAFLRVLGFSEVVALNFNLLVIVFLSVLFMFIASKKIFKKNLIAISSSIFYCFPSYMIYDLYGRGAYGELTAFMLVPLFILSVYEIFFGDKKKFWIFCISASLIYQNHMLSAYLYAGLVAVFFIIYLFAKRKSEDYKERMKTFILSSILVVLINAWYLFPQIYEFLFVDFINPAFWNGNHYFAAVDFNSFFKGDYHVTFSMILLVLLLFYLLYTKIYNKKINSSFTDKYFLTSFIFTIIGTIYLVFELKGPLDYILNTKLAFLLEVIQFRHRLNIIAIPMFALGAPYFIYCIIKTITNKYYNSKLKYLLFIVSIVFFSFQGVIRISNFVQSGNLKNFIISTWNLDYYLQGTLTDGEFNYNFAPISSSEDINIKKFKMNYSNINCEYEVDDYKNKYIELPLFAYPVYKVLDENNEEVKFERGYNNLIRVNLTKNSGTLKTIQYEPIFWLIGDIISLITILSIIVYFIYKYLYKRKISNPPYKNKK